MSPTLFDLSGHGYYLWASYGMMALAIIIELWWLGRRRRKARAQAASLAAEAPVRKAQVQ